MRKFLHDNGLSLTLLFLFLGIFWGHSLAGMLKYNSDQQEHGKPTVTYLQYVTGKDFLEATAENWESEFLQLFTYVIMTRFFYQKGSAESKPPEEEPATEEDKKPGKHELPWPVRKGGLLLKLYEHSLSLAFFLLFLLSFLLHAVGGAGEYNQEQLNHGSGKMVSAWGYLFTSTFWFESLQNWQSEFLAILAVVVFTIWLREKGSPESKPVDAPHNHTGK